MTAASIVDDSPAGFIPPFSCELCHQRPQLDYTATAGRELTWGEEAAPENPECFSFVSSW